MNKIAKYRDNRIPGKWFLTEFTMEQVEGRLEFLEKENKQLVYDNGDLDQKCSALEIEVEELRKRHLCKRQK
jgi:predicted RNase H-like nuclease (RuvC/YqgF family)